MKMKHKNLDQEATTKPWASYTNSHNKPHGPHTTHTYQNRLERQHKIPICQHSKHQQNKLRTTQMFTILQLHQTTRSSQLDRVYDYSQQSLTEHNHTANTEQCHSVCTKHSNMPVTSRRSPKKLYSRL